MECIQEEIISLSQKIIDGLENDGTKTSFEYLNVGVSFFTDKNSALEWSKKYFENYFVCSDTKNYKLKILSSFNKNYYQFFNNIPWLNNNFNDFGEKRYKLNNDIEIVAKKDIDETNSLISYCIIDKKDQKLLLINNPEHIRSDYFTMRILRSSINFLLAEDNWIFLHASCVEKDGVGIAIVGDRFAGKTTCMVNLLNHGGYKYIANDKTAVYTDKNRVKAAGFPRALGVRIGSVFVFDKLRTWLLNNKSVKEDLIQYKNYDYTQLMNVDEKIYLSSGEISSIFNTCISPLSNLDIIIIPQYDDSIKEPKLIKLEKSEIKSVLMNQLLFGISSNQNFIAPLFNVKKEMIINNFNKLVNSNSIKFFRFMQNRDTLNMAANLIDEKVQSLKSNSFDRLRI